MTAILADDPTAAAVLATVPCYPVPPSGRSPAIDALRDAETGQGLAVGSDGVMLILRRPWLELDAPATTLVDAYLPYGSVGRPRANLRCGLIPHELFACIIDHFTDALPNEAAAFILWSARTGAFWAEFPTIDEATPSRLVYQTPQIPPYCHIVCDSHGHGAAFFSSTDDADDAHATKIALVVGRLGHPAGPSVASRICAAGMFLPMPRSPFTGGHDAA